ncbi:MULTISPECIES: type II toxin-antitoxin system Phd/YefM family antitoxin [Eubacteriales]|uniref:type II toxin-antitoxin system Phd/YefM family antitoxin n=1 Tax=Eubacteriales TaxID=186802 RepID=UPI0008205EC8|nr:MULTISPECIES: type II toxin-antitoxin system Phd/YefM family antitoxin [unclassified Flavonifractor]MCI7659796.1 type II toxin-antitoxin system Phd/YefM family antitoxin [Flintibacter sp.]OUN14066.1 prevent-host-death protein [Flavonifractor sp. An91]OUQ81053.1 prevent-host-death protein [Flavonifractor sp. An100]SCJ54165.1 prevent-host-death family protein [uncultured Flavonifractor sp.]
MLDIRPVSDLRNKFSEIEETVKSGQPVYLTKNGYGSMVVLSLEQYAALTDEVELRLDEADRAAAADSVRYTEEEVFGRVRSRLHERKAL